MEILPNKLRPYRCDNCGNETEQETNHEQDFYWPCKVCSHEKGGEYIFLPHLFGDKKLRTMKFIKPE